MTCLAPLHLLPFCFPSKITPLGRCGRTSQSVPLPLKRVVNSTQISKWTYHLHKNLSTFVEAVHLAHKMQTVCLCFTFLLVTNPISWAIRMQLYSRRALLSGVFLKGGGSILICLIHSEKLKHRNLVKRFPQSFFLLPLLPFCTIDTLSCPTPPQRTCVPTTPIEM